MPAPQTKPRNRTGPRRAVAWAGWVAGALALTVVALIISQSGKRPNGASPSAAAPPGIRTALLEPEAEVFARYAGSASCQGCHPEEYEQWARSHHGLAERLPNLEWDREAFEPARTYTHAGGEVRVARDGTNMLVNCLGLSGSNETHQVVRVLGHAPLRQFLVPFPGGRLQTLQASYDPVQRDWFDVYGEEDRQPGEWGHWTGRGMNWNTMCAGCHNTRVRKNYEETTDTFRTTMAEMTVGCESCHGPLKAHNEWQAVHGRSGLPDPTVPRFSRQQVFDNCGFCHARRSDLTGDFKPGDGFFDHQSLAVVDSSDVFYPDGQVREENYEFAAFYGSRMHTNGVRCVDCHNPHSAKTILPGNWLCLRCHDGSYPGAPTIQPVAHSHHKVFGYDSNGRLVNPDLSTYDSRKVTETGGECINCHMPQTVYMQRHWRHDHGFTIPDPTLTRDHGIPNACNRCHQDQTVEWAVAATEKWYGEKLDRPARQRTQWLARARAGEAAAREPLLQLFQAGEAAYWRGVIAGLLGQWATDPIVSAALLKALHDDHPLVREQAVQALAPLAAGVGGGIARSLRPLLEDPVRNVRVAAAWALRTELPEAGRAAAELRHFLDLNADQPTGQMQKGAYAQARGQAEQALLHYRKAVEWDPRSAPIRHDLAIVLSSLGQAREAVAQLETAVRLEPKEAEYPFKLGLAWNELGDMNQASRALEKAVELDPAHARAWFNLGLARQATGRREAALDALLRAEGLNPQDPQIPYARAAVLAAAGRGEEARRAAARALEVDPRHTQAARLLRELSDRAK